MYQSNNDPSLIIIVFVLVTIISLVILYHIIKGAVKSAVQDELFKTNALIEWHLRKKYPEINDIGQKAKKYGEIMREKEELDGMYTRGAMKEKKYLPKIEEIKTEMDKCLK